MRVLLLGATGLVGRHLHAVLHAHDVVAASFTGREATRKVDLRDLRELRGILATVEPEVVINAAAEAWVERCESDPSGTRAVNVEPVRALADDSARRGRTLVVLSSEYVFDGSRGAYAEEDETRPLNEYGRQKVEIEQIASGVPRHLIVRTSGVYGAEPARKNFVLQLVDRLRTGREFPVPSDQLITPTYAPSLAGAILELLSSRAVGIYHVAGPRILSRIAFAELVADTFGLQRQLLTPVSTTELRLAAARPKRAGLSDHKLRSAIGHATAPPEEGVRAVAAADTL